MHIRIKGFKRNINVKYKCYADEKKNNVIYRIKPNMLIFIYKKKHNTKLSRQMEQ